MPVFSFYERGITRKIQTLPIKNTYVYYSNYYIFIELHGEANLNNIKKIIDEYTSIINTLINLYEWDNIKFTIEINNKTINDLKNVELMSDSYILFKFNETKNNLELIKYLSNCLVYYKGEF